MTNSRPILLVDDDEDIRELTKVILENVGYIVAQATNGVEGLNMVKQGAYSAIITDYMMPEINGYEFALEVRKINSNIPIILITGYLQAMNEQEVRIFDGVLQKPVEPSLIIDKLEEFMKSKFRA